MSFEAIRVEGAPVDEELLDAATVGPETAYYASVYLATPRALVWRHASPEWPLLVLMLPLASRLSLMRNPIFAQLVRDWGHQVRFLGVDSERRLFDFRRLLDSAVLGRLVDALAVWLSQPVRQQARAPASQPAREDATLDVLFAALADGMLTVLEKRRSDWPAHLAREHRLEPGKADTLFERQARYPDFLGRLRGALRDELVDVDFYARALRSIEIREQAFECRLAAHIEAELQPGPIARLKRLPVGLHLGAYNWLAIDPRHASQRAYVLSRLACCAHFFADTLLGEHEAGDAPAPGGSRAPQRPTDLRRAETDPPWLDREAFAQWLARAVDSGQDRLVIAAVSRRFGISENTVRALWREPPSTLGTPPAWHLRQILLRLDALPSRQWPRSPSEWQTLMSRAVPSVAA